MSEMAKLIRSNMPVVEDPSIETIRVEDNCVRLAPGKTLDDFTDKEIDCEVGHALGRAYCRVKY